MKKELTGTAAKVLPIIEKTVLGNGCTVWDVEFVKEGADHILRITIDTDREGGIDIDDCERVHRAVDPVLDEADPIENSYYLQISSPGVERDLTQPWHVEACAGEKVEARLFAPVNGKRTWTGVLVGFADESRENVLLTPDGGETVALPYDGISRMHVVFDFGQI